MGRGRELSTFKFARLESLLTLCVMPDSSTCLPCRACQQVMDSMSLYVYAEKRLCCMRVELVIETGMVSRRNTCV